MHVHSVNGQQMDNILIAGGTGLVGKALAAALYRSDNAVSYLTRSRKAAQNPAYHYWDPSEGILPREVLTDKDVIINLSGAGIADRRWTNRRKRILTRSRIISTRLLVSAVNENPKKPRLFINASAIGYYGDRPDEQISESSVKGSGFLSELCHDWENELVPLRIHHIPVAILRFGIIFSASGGSLPKLIKPIRFGINPVLAGGRQMVSWIHIRDAIAVIIDLIGKSLEPGVFNVVAPHPMTQSGLNRILLKVHRKRAISVGLSKPLLRFLLGDLSSVLTDDQHILAGNLTKQNFSFSFPEMEPALRDLLEKEN